MKPMPPFFLTAGFFATCGAAGTKAVAYPCTITAIYRPDADGLLKGISGPKDVYGDAAGSPFTIMADGEIVGRSISTGRAPVRTLKQGNSENSLIFDSIYQGQASLYTLRVNVKTWMEAARKPFTALENGGDDYAGYCEKLARTQCNSPHHRRPVRPSTSLSLSFARSREPSRRTPAALGIPKYALASMSRPRV